MKNLLPIDVVLPAVLIIIFMGSHFSLDAQNMKVTNEKIIFSRNKSYKPRLEIAKKNRYIAYRPEGDSIMHGSKITAITGDTIFIDDTCYRVCDISYINFDFYPWQTYPSLNNLLMEDSIARKDSDSGPSGWTVYYPPADISSNHFALSFYLRDLKHEIAREKRDKTNPLICSNFLKLNVAKLFHLEFAIAYELKIDSAVSWETEIGYQVGIQDAPPFIIMDYPLFNYEGWSLLTYPKFFSPGGGFYLGPAFLYKYLSFHDVSTSFPKVDGAEFLQDQYRHDLGISLRLGSMKRYGHFITDVYFGFGFRYSWINQVLYGKYNSNNEFSWQNQAHSSTLIHSTYSSFILNFGLKIGAGW